MSSPSGVLVVDKPRGPTSHDVVACARRVLGTRQIGHAGTLDPMATGVLVIAVDEATKLVQWLTATDKTYEATLRLGVATDSFDADGRETERAPIDEAVLTELRALGNIEVTKGNIDVTKEFPRLAEALRAERIRAQQVPPAFSAIRVGGARSHVLARRGEAPELAARAVEVRGLTIVGGGVAPEPHVRLVVEVTKGYFVRSLARDLAAALGTVGHLTSLRRIRAGAFALADAFPLREDMGPADRAAARAAMIPLDRAAARALPVSTLGGDGVRAATLGQRVKPEDLRDPHPCASAWLDDTGRLVAVGEAMPDGSGRVLRGFPRVIRSPSMAPDEDKPAHDSLRPPVQAYDPRAHHELGARISHPEHGLGSVTSVGETWIVVAFDAGGTKRLEQKP